MYQKYQQNDAGLGASIGGMLHDAVALVVFISKKTDTEEVIFERIKRYIKKLRFIADEEKLSIPIIQEKEAKKAELDKWQIDYDLRSKEDDAIKENTKSLIN